ncbi:MAG: hypothetical protein ACYSTY_11420 [Planctomycetota bacterium]|jgi:hypothetical protein
MAADSAHLLRRLEPAVRPAFATPPPPPHPQPPLEGQSFDELLALARQGSVPSGRAVQWAADPARPLDEQQLTRLSAAADVAEAAGARRALMLIDGRGVVLDVANRALVAELADDGAARAVKVDAAVGVPDPDHDSEGPPVTPPSPDLMRQVTGATSAREQAAEAASV